MGQTQGGLVYILHIALNHIYVKTVSLFNDKKNKLGGAILEWVGQFWTFFYLPLDNMIEFR